MIKCPDILTIQAVIDGEESNRQILSHLKECANCSQDYQELDTMVNIAARIYSNAKLPEHFFAELAAKTKPRIFPTALVAAVLFFITIFSAYLVNPGFMHWWLSAGITHHLGYLIDLCFHFLYIGHAAGPGGVITALAALVMLEVILLNYLRKAEGQTNG